MLHREVGFYISTRNTCIGILLHIEGNVNMLYTLHAKQWLYSNFCVRYQYDPIIIQTKSSTYFVIEYKKVETNTGPSEWICTMPWSNIYTLSIIARKRCAQCMQYYSAMLMFTHLLRKLVPVNVMFTCSLDRVLLCILHKSRVLNQLIFVNDKHMLSNTHTW